MSRKQELKREFGEAMRQISKWGLAKLNNLTEEQVEQEAHLMGIDIVHDACHTLRGRLPSTEKVTLSAMREAWEKEWKL